jgi:hypothetical protein
MLLSVLYKHRLSVRRGRNGISPKQWIVGSLVRTTALPLSLFCSAHLVSSLRREKLKKIIIKKDISARTMILDVLFTKQELALIGFFFLECEKSGNISQMQICTKLYTFSVSCHLFYLFLPVSASYLCPSCLFFFNFAIQTE